MWNIIDENDSSTLPQVDYGYFLVTLEYYAGGGVRTVDKSFYTKDREVAKKHHGAYSRKHQGLSWMKSISIFLKIVLRKY